MTRLVLHIGVHKTGTTAFQSFMWRNRHELPAHGVAYCDGFRRSNHAELAIAFSGRINPLTRWYDVSTPDDRHRLRDRLPEMFGDLSRAATWVASSEHFISLLRNPDRVVELAEFLHLLFDDVDVVAALRRPDYWLPSMYLESVKSGGIRPFDADFVARHQFAADYTALLDRWAAAFGHDRVRAVPFLETDKGNPLAVPERLLDVVGIPSELWSSWSLPPRVVNPSISSYGTELLRHLNKHRKDTPLKRAGRRPRTVQIVREGWPGRPPHMTRTAAAELHRRGWVRTDLRTMGFATGEEWTQWLDQPDAEIARLPRARRRDMQQLMLLLQSERLIRPKRPLHRRALGRARRQLRQLLPSRRP